MDNMCDYILSCEGCSYKGEQMITARVVVLFKAYKEKKIIYCNLREKPYYENMPTEPEVLLEDFVKAFHPELLPDYQPKYYELLK